MLVFSGFSDSDGIHLSTGLFQINAESGEILVQKPLTGRGRNYPYSLTVRAEDSGYPVLFTDAQVNVLIGDVVSNDGIPVFIRPSEEEKAFVSEVGFQ